MSTAARTLATLSRQQAAILNLVALDQETVTLLEGAAQLRARLVELRRAAAASDIANQTAEEWLAAYDQAEVL